MNKNTRYAKNEYDEIIEAKKNMNKEQNFTCLGCKEQVKVYAIQSKKQTTHFRHINNKGTGKGCGSYESYIHNFSKHKFAESYKKNEDFFLEQKLNIRCVQSKYSECTMLMKDKINLKEKYPYIEIEKKDDNFIPDCLIYNDQNEKIYIEIKYKSPVSQKKINSGIPIIEISVEDEDDILNIIEKKSIDDYMMNINLINFEKIIPNSVYNCQNICPQDKIEADTKQRIEIEKRQYLDEIQKKKEEKNQYIKQEQEEQIFKEIREKNQQSIIKKQKNWEKQFIQSKPTILGTKTVQLFRPKKCFECPTNPIHYMNVGRVVINEKYNILSIEKEQFKEEIETSTKFSIAKRQNQKTTNAYYCPTCGCWIANNRILKGSTYIYKDENIILC